MCLRVCAGDMLSMLSLSFKFVNETYGSLCDVFKGAGWRIDQVQLRSDEWRADWTPLVETKKHF